MEQTKILLDQIGAFQKAGFFMINEKGIVEYANKAISSLLGIHQEKILNLPFTAINTSISFQEWKKIWKKIIKRKNTLKGTSILLGKDQKMIPVKFQLNIIKYKKIHFALYQIKEDSKDEIKNKLLDLSNLLGNVGTWKWNLITNKILLSRQASKMLNLDHQDYYSPSALFKTFCRTVEKTDLHMFFKTFIAQIKKGKTIDLELVQRNQNGKIAFTHHVVGKCLIIDDQTNKVFGTIQNASSIAKRSIETKFSELSLKYAQTGISWVSEDASIHFANDKMVQLLGYSKDELLNMKVFDYNFGIKGALWKKTWDSFEEHKTIQIETTHVRKNGSSYPALVVISWITHGGNRYAITSIRDLTAKKLKDEKLELGYATLNLLHNLIICTKKDGTIVFVNEAFSNDSHLILKDQNLNIFEISKGLTKNTFNNYWGKAIKGQSISFESNLQLLENTFKYTCTMEIIETQETEFACLIYQNSDVQKEKEAALRTAIKEIEDLKNELTESNTYLIDQLTADYDFNNIITQNKEYQKILRQVATVADTDSTVLISGETGTGKELLAKAIYKLSNRDDRQLVIVNCGALPKDLIESELFGHVKGAFTGAYLDKKGRFELADKGTIFLDEIGELSMRLQTRLLRVLQEGTFEKIGSNETQEVDVRIIAATNRNLKNEIAKGRFREDLYYRLNVFPIHNIPLRERKDDIPLLAEHFIKKVSKRLNKKIARIRKIDMNKLMKYEFPGNVRELENIIERAVVISSSDSLHLKTIIDSLFEDSPVNTTFPTFEEIQKAHIEEALHRTHWKISGKNSAAELLNMNGKTLASKMKKFNINREKLIL